MASKKRKTGGGSDRHQDDVDDDKDWRSPPSSNANTNTNTNRTILTASRKRVAVVDYEAEKYKNDILSLRQQALEALSEQYHDKLNKYYSSNDSSSSSSSSSSNAATNPALRAEYIYWYSVHYYTQLRRINTIYPIQNAGVLRQVMGMGSEDTNSIGLLKTSDDDNKKDYYPPTIVRNLPRHDIVSVACGAQTSAALTVNGVVYTWGVNDDAALGRFVADEEVHLIKKMDAPTTTDSETPNGYMHNVVQVRMGDSHMLLLTTSGDVYSTGMYKDSESKRYRDLSKAQRKAYNAFKGKSKEEQEAIEKLSRTKGGFDEDSQDPRIQKYIPTGLHGGNLAPTRVESIPRKVMEIGSGFSWNAAILDDGTLWTWGIGCSGQLARSRTMGAKATKAMEYKPAIQGSTERRNPPIGDLYDVTTRDDASGRETITTMYNTYDLDKNFMGVFREVAVLDKEGKSKLDEKTGKPEMDLRYFVDSEKVSRTMMTPAPVEWAGQLPLQKREVVQFACGFIHLIVVARDFGVFSPRVYSSGGNNYGQLGHGDLFERHELTPILALDYERISKAACGEFHSMALAMDGSHVFAWGGGDKGQLGLYETRPNAGALEATPKEVKFPAETMGSSRIVDIFCGATTSFARTNKGTLYSWGFNDSGATGQPSDNENDILLPKLVELKNTIVDSVSGGAQHSLFNVRQYRGASS